MRAQILRRLDLTRPAQGDLAVPDGSDCHVILIRMKHDEGRGGPWIRATPNLRRLTVTGS
jgi:hypothetical protein